MSKIVVARIREQRLKNLLKDCKESFEWLIEREEWDTLEEGSSAKVLIKQIERETNE